MNFTLRGKAQELFTMYIPIFLGVPMFILGFIGLIEKYRNRALFASMILMILGFFGTLNGPLRFYTILNGYKVINHTDIYMQSIASIMCLVFVILAIMSLIRSL
jgi:hypothetical protein